MEGIPDIPALPAPKLSVEELAGMGESVLTELGLFKWWKPTGYVRWAVEALHNHADLPWWSVIIAGSCIPSCCIAKSR